MSLKWLPERKSVVLGAPRSRRVSYAFAGKMKKECCDNSGGLTLAHSGSCEALRPAAQGPSTAASPAAGGSGECSA